MLMPVLLAAAIFAGDANATQGVFVRELSLAPSALVVAWSPPSIAASVRRGTSYTEALWLDVSADTSDVSLEVSQSLADVIESFEIPDPYDLTTGREYFPITFDIPKSAALGPRTGTVAVRSSTGGLLAELTVNLEVTEPVAGVVPTSLAQPASSRIGRDEDGLLMVLDGLLVGIDDTAPDPEQRILAIAQAHNAIVMGSIPDLRMYQLMLDVSDLAELEAVRLAIASEANVAFASESVLGSTGPIVPNDPDWGGLIAVIAGAGVALVGGAWLWRRRSQGAT
jgi:MYXO-CTERM domain-containing protein